MPIWADQAVNRRHPAVTTGVFSAADRLGQALSFGFGLSRDHAHEGGARSR